MKTYVQAFLRRFGLLERIQGSLLYDLYWRFADPKVLDTRSTQERFYREVLTGLEDDALIFDIGANCGDKTDLFLRLGARVVSVEPDESNQEVLTRRFLRYRLSKKPVSVIGKAVSDSNTVETMWLDAEGSALNTLSHKRVETLTHDPSQHPSEGLGFKQEVRVATTTLEDLFAIYGVPFFVKIDVEGYELNVLRGMKRAVPYVSFEVNLPEFEEEGLQCIAALEHLGANGRFNYTFDCDRGLELSEWVGAKEFASVFRGCADRPIEVFWKA